jgi:hypothetical protein
MTTRVRGNVVGIKGDECDCGRRSSVLHCNACGSTRIYARTGRLHTHLDGTTKFVETQLRCQTCGHLFIQEERQFCEAPPVSEALARLKVQRLAQAREQGEFLRPHDAQAADAIVELLAQSKVEPEETSTEDAPAEVTSEASIPSKEADREGYEIATYNLRREWVLMNANGQAPTKTAQEYVERKLKGELFQ